jgi:hypothetical protein
MINQPKKLSTFWSSSFLDTFLEIASYIRRAAYVFVCAALKAIEKVVAEYPDQYFDVNICRRKTLAKIKPS